MVCLGLLLLLISAYAGAATTCPRGWLPGDGACYLFGTYNLHFTEAEHYCRQHKGHLVEVSTAHENNFIKSFLKQLQPRYWWMGITDESIEGEWRSYSSDTLVNFTDWGPGEPGPHNRLDVEDCAFFDKDYSFAWADADCTSDYLAPLCKMRGQSCEEAIIG